jgi:DGQHR domain-containing protein
MSSDIANQIAAPETKEQDTLVLLLDKYLSQENRLLVQTTQMGKTPAYIGSVSLEWLDSRVRFASQLPLFRHKFDPETKNIIPDAETIEEIQQRPLDWSRQAPLAQYLIARDTHKFPPVLVVISPNWVDDPYAEEWDLDDRAKQSAADFSPLDKTGKLGLLNVSPGVSVFALDGQHRLMAIQGLMELIRTGSLPCYNKNKTLTHTITTDDLTAEYGINAASLQNLAYEQIGIEFIPAVLKGETREEARRRVRSIFVHVNLMAVRLSRGQLALLDEDNGFAIVARKLAVTHPLLAEHPHHNPRVNWDSATVATKSTVLTTLQALQDMAERYLSPKYPHWQSNDKKNLLPLRPSDDELDTGLQEFKILLDYLATLPSYQKLEEGLDTPNLRRFSHEKGGGEANILFRPVGQIALAQALGTLVYRRGLSLDEIFAKLRTFDDEGGFSSIEYSDSLWYGILYDPIKKRIQVSGRDLAARLLVYLVANFDSPLERAKLRQDFVEARTIEEKTISYEGKFVSPRELNLPPVLT